MVQFKRTLDDAHEYLQICRLPEGATLTSEALDGAESPFVVQISADANGEGDFVGLYDLDGMRLQAHQHSGWEIADEVPAEVVEAVGNWSDVRRAVVARTDADADADPYAACDIGEAVALSQSTSALPSAGARFDFADVDDDSALHEFEQRLRGAGLELHNDGGGFTVRKRSA
jgi:hypothetical protein